MRRVPSPSVAVVAVTLICYATTGCLSNEYAIPRSELTRLSQLPPAERGGRVRVIQSLGSRRAPALPANLPPADGGGYGPGYDPAVQVHGGFDVHVDPLPRAHHGGASYATSGSPGHVTQGTWRAGSGQTANAPGPAPAPAPSTSSSGGTWRGGSSGGSGGGGKSDGAEALAVIAIVLVAVAAFAAVGFAVTEGARYDGWADVAPHQPVHLVYENGGQRTTTLAQLTEADAAHASEAIVKDDEAYGLSLAGRAPLDRKGFAFKVDVGQLQTALQGYGLVGLAGNIQLGYFPLRTFGVLGTLSLTGGDDALGKTFIRHSAGLEAQWFPFHLGPVHFGGYFNGGRTVVEADMDHREGPSVGAGGLVEIELTTRLALTMRAGWSSALLPAEMNAPGERWSPSAVFTGGLAIY